ncbi:unnamed protein product [Xylocopa violacea]|uniref:C2H2-type domain-containing protein n=1 Tax=Xylocopa violacea TaxID=135666 RepID=A0ABP1MXY7_XYLVO
MARVLKYVRLIEPVYEREKLDENLSPSKCGVQVKKEPLVSEINVETFSASARDQGNKNSKQKSAQKMKTVRKTCPICMAVLKHKFALESHLKKFNEQYACKKCNAIFAELYSCKKHSEICGTDKISHSSKFHCNFCNRSYKDKSYLQRHLFHVHGNAINSGGTELKSTSLETLEKPNNSNSTLTNNLGTSNSPSFLTRRSSLNSVPLVVLNDLSNSVSLNNSPTLSVKMLNDSYSTPSKTKDLYQPPAKKFKQTTLTDFVAWHKSKPKKECVTPTKEEDVSVSPSSNVRHKLTEETTDPSAPIDRTVAARSSTKPPFVHIHVSPKTMLSLFNEEMQAQLDYRCLAYNLRPTRSISSISHHSESWTSSESPISSRTCQNIRYTRKRNRFSRLFNSSQRTQLSDAELKVKFKCKECVILLNRCDEDVKRAKSKSNEPENTVEQVNSKGSIEKSENLGEMNSVASSPCLKTIIVPLVKFVHLEKSAESEMIASQEQIDGEGNVEQTKVFRCHFCRKSSSSIKNLHEHVKQSHKIYISTICNARYSSMKRLVNHYLSQHIVFKRKKCCVCYEKFRTTVLLKRHLMLHCAKIIPSKNDTLPVDAEMNCITAKKPHKCKGCSKRFWLNSCLLQHQKMCSRMNAHINEESTVPTKNLLRSPSLKGKKCISSALTAEVTSSNSDSNVGDLQQPPSLPTQRSPNKHPVQTSESEAIPAKEADTEILDSSCASSTLIVNNRRLINRVMCVKGYQVNDTNKMKFPCTICGKRFHTFQNLCIHENTFCKPVTSICSICGTAFTTKRLLQLHMLATHTPRSTERYKLFCRFCNQGFNKNSNLQVHERHFHIRHIPKTYLNPEAFRNLNNPTCGTCNLMFQSYEHFIEHNMYYYKDQVFGCPICDKSFRGMYMLHHHNKLVHYPEKIRKSYVHVCNLCNVGFNYESHLHAHKCHVHADDPSSMLNDLSTLQDHTYALMTKNIAMIEELVKSPVKTYSCRVCDLNFTNPQDLATHKNEYTQGGDLLCDKCDRRCYTSSVLAQHYSLNHTGSDIGNAFKCRYCGEVLTTAMSMRCHEKHFHENTSGSNIDSSDSVDNVKLEQDDANSNTCLTCGTSFDDKETLKEHLLEYSDIGEHSCVMCQRRFTESHLLERHKMKHSMFVLSSHRCPICNEGFADSTSINMHVLHLHRFETSPNSSSNVVNVTDFREAVKNVRSPPTSSFANSVLKKKMVKCTDCKIEFSNRKNLLKHTSRFKNTGEYKCTICDRRFSWLTMLAQHERKHSEGDNRLLKHECPHCMEKFRSSVSLYSHIIHAHDKDILAVRPSSDVNGSEINDVQGGDTSNKSAATMGASITTIDANEMSKLEAVKGDLNNAEKYFSYTCHICDMRCSTLSEFQTHSKAIHKRDLKASEPNSVQSDVVTHSAVSSTAVNVEGNLEKDDGQPPVTQATDQVSSSNQIEIENTDNSSNSVGDDAIQVVWDKKSKAVECVTIDDEEDLDVQIIVDDGSLSNKQEDVTLLEDIIVLNNVGKLRVKSFAKMVDGCEIINA